jgi:hypothetical protein
MAVRIVPVIDDHAVALAATMRSEDVRECYRQGAESALDAVRYSISVSCDCWTCLMDGEVAGIFGVRAESILTGTGSLWLLTSDLCDRRKVAFVKIAKRCLREIVSRWPRLSVGVDVHHDKALRFAPAVGFVAAPGSYPHQVTGEPMRHHVWGN